MGELLSLLDEEAVRIEVDDDLRIGELVGARGGGVRVAELLLALELPLDSPLDAARHINLDVPLRELARASLVDAVDLLIAASDR